jgi:hypothetical protein
MLDLKISGPRNAGAEVARSLRDIPATVLPYAASTAATRTAQYLARTALPNEMRRVFTGPTRWTLNSLRIFPATKSQPFARVSVKDDAPNNGTRPENYLLPQVEGGGRKEKRFERSMRYAGLLPAGWRAMPGEGAKLDADGNFQRGEMQRILTATRSAFDPYQNKTNSKRSRRNARNAPYFGITPSAGAFTRQGSGAGRTVFRPSSLTPGVYRREGRAIRPVLIFTKTLPQYSARLDFTGVSERVTLERFPQEFDRAVSEILARRPGRTS